MSEILRNFGKGITVASGFDLGAKSPLDSRSTVATLVERDEHVTGNRAYAGMLVYVEEDQKTYQYLGTEKGWKEFGFNAGDFQASVVNDLTTGGADKALSAEQGKVLKGLVDDETQARTEAVEALQSDLDGYKTTTDETLALKAEKAQVALDIEAAKAEIQGKLDTKVEKNAILGSDGKILNTVLPSLAIGEKYVVEDVDSAMLLEVQIGDIVFITDGAAATYGAARALAVSAESVGKTAFICVDPEGVTFDDRFRPLHTNGDAITKSEVQTLITAETEARTQAVSEVDGKVQQEVLDRKGEITRVEGLLTTEKQERTAADEALAGRLTVIEGVGEGSISKALEDAKAFTTAEIEKVNSASTELAGRVSTLEGDVTQAKADILANTGKIDAETLRATTAESSLGTQISDEVSRAQGEEARIEAKVDAAQLEIDAEETRAQAAEARIEGKVDAEVLRATGAEQAIQAELTAAKEELAQLKETNAQEHEELQAAIDLINAARDEEELFTATENQVEFLLKYTPSVHPVKIIINGVTYKEKAGHITVDRESKKVTWMSTSGNNGFDLIAGFEVIIEYKTSEAAIIA